MNTSVLAAFDMLLEAINGEKARLAEAVKETMLSGRFAEAQQLLARTERIERLTEQVRRLQETWKRLGKERDAFVVPERSAFDEKMPRIDDEEAPELAVVREIFSQHSRRYQRRARQAINKTPQSAYRVPILKALEQLGGKGRMREVLGTVYEKMKDNLTEDDLRPVPSGRAIRWKNTAQWELSTMIKDGLLRDDSPTGIWEITDEGRMYLDRIRQQIEKERAS